MSKDRAQELGKIGEVMAANFLQSKGFDVLDRNWRFGRIELDIIAQFEEQIVFVEVKTRENRFLGEPWQAVTPAKQRRIIKAANAYLVENEIDLEARFDIVSIVCNSKVEEIEHLEEAFYAMV
jgi:putative endonuclease